MFRIDNPTQYFCGSKNPYKIHSGALTIWNNLACSLGLYTFDNKKRRNWQVLNMSQDFVNSAHAFQPLFLKVTVRKIGNQVAFADCTIMNDKGELVSFGSNKMRLREKLAKL